MRQTVILGFTRLNPETSLIFELFKQHNLSLALLGTDLFHILKDGVTSTLHKQCLLIDLLEMNALNALDFDPQEIHRELELMISEIKDKIKDFKGILKYVQFYNPDTLILEFAHDAKANFHRRIERPRLLAFKSSHAFRSR